MRLLIFLLILSVGATSCFHVYYIPNTPNAPLLAEKGETRVNVLYTTGANSEYNGGELQFAHAVSKNVGIMVNGFTAGKTETVDNWFGNQGSHTEKGNGSYIEFAGGYFKKFDAKEKWMAEVYGGLGFGSAHNDYGFNDHTQVNSSKLFIQPSIGYKGKHFEIAVVPKVSLINWKVKESQVANTDNDYVKADMDAIRSKPGFVSFEPAVLLRAGTEQLKFQFAISTTSSRSTILLSDDLVETVNASLGISINIGPKKK
jgi:hypothetical protein